MLCSMEAMWRCLGYEMYPAPSPSITTIKPKLPQQVLELRSDQKWCDLQIYFDRPRTDQFRDILFTEFFKYWRYGDEKNIPVTHRSKVLNSINGDIHKVVERTVKPFYIYKRINPDDHIVRMTMSYVNMGEIWYILL